MAAVGVVIVAVAIVGRGGGLVVGGGFGFGAGFGNFVFEFGGEVEGELFLLTQSLGVVAEFAEGLGEIGGESVQGVNFFGVHPFDHFDEVGEIGVVADGKGGVALVAVAAAGIDGPAGEDGGAGFAEFTEHGGASDVRRTDEDFAVGRGGVVEFVVGKGLAEVFVNLGEFVDGGMEHDGESGLAEAAEEFLAFAKGIAVEDGGFVVVDGLLAETDDALHDFVGGRELIAGPAEGGFHDEDVGGARFAEFGGAAGAEFEIAGVKERLAFGFDEGHGAAEDVAGGDEGDLVAGAVVFVGGGLAEFQNVFLSRAADAGEHEF